MKKDYLKPESTVVEISIDTIMDNSSVRPGVGPEGEWSNEHRGDWGNIWGEEE